MKDIIRHILKEETSAQSKLLGIIKRFGIDYGAKAVGGFDRLNKIMEGTDFIYVKIDVAPDEVRKYLDGDKNWGRRTFYGAILRDPYDFHSWGEYDVDNLMDDIDAENLTIIRLILSEESGEDLTTTSIDELLEYDTFGHISEAINHAANTIDSDAYGDYLYNQLKKAFEEYGGEVFSMDDTGVTFTANLGKYLKDLTDEEYGYYRNVCQDNYVCMFNEMVYDDGGIIDRPRPYFSDNWWNNNFDNTQFNEIISDNLQEYLN